MTALLDPSNFFTLTGYLQAVITDYTDAGDTPDAQAVTCSVTITPRIPRGELVWASGLTPPTGIALAPIRCRVDTDGYLRTIQNSAQNATQRVQITGSPGTFPLTFNGVTTASPISTTATAATVQTALEGLSSIGAGNVSVGGNPGNWYVTFNGTKGYAPQPLMTTTASGVSISTTQVGGLYQGVQLIANTDAVDRDQLIYDVDFANIVYNRDDTQVITSFAFEAPSVGGITVDMSSLQRLPARTP